MSGSQIGDRFAPYALWENISALLAEDRGASLDFSEVGLLSPFTLKVLVAFLSTF